MLNSLLKVDSWMSVVAVASLGITLAAALLGLWTSQGPRAEVSIETVSETNVLDLRRPLQDLTIVFRGQNVEEQNLNLRILTIKVANTGTTDILSNHYDPEVEWGIEFSTGEVIEVRLVDAKSDYLRSRVAPRLEGIDTIVFPNVILEQGESFAIEVLLLHLKNESPLVSPIGKIAGIREIGVSTRPLDSQEASLLSRLFPGGPLIQVIRTTIYFFGLLVAIVAAIVATFFVTQMFGKIGAWRRRRRVSRTRTIRQIRSSELKEFLVNFYALHGNSGQQQLQEFTRDPQRAATELPLDAWIAADSEQQDDWTPSILLFDPDSEWRINPFLEAISKFD